MRATQTVAHARDEEKRLLERSCVKHGASWTEDRRDAARAAVLPEVIQKSLSGYPMVVELSVNGRDTWVTIESALYGCDGDIRDVREAVWKYIVDGRIQVVVSNKTLGIDPCPGTPKELVVTYSSGDGRPIEVRGKEHDTLRVP